MLGMKMMFDALGIDPVAIEKAATEIPAMVSQTRDLLVSIDARLQNIQVVQSEIIERLERIENPGVDVVKRRAENFSQAMLELYPPKEAENDHDTGSDGAGN